jgi:tetratricopeptide (TPR) repeat protein
MPDDLVRLTTLLRHAEGGTWALAVYESAIIRKQIMGELRATLAPLPVLEERLGSDRADPLAILQALPLDDHAAPVVSLTGIEESFPSLFGYLDLQRELLAQMPHRLILWVTEYGWRELADHAPNFYSRLSGVFRFPGRVLTGETRTESQHRPDRPAPPSGPRLRPPVPVQDERDRERRIVLLERRAAELAAMSKPDPDAIAGTHYDLGALYEGAYRWQQARAAYTEAARWYAQAGRIAARAESLFQVGRTCYYRDQWTEAETAFFEALTLFRLVGDRLGEANVLKAQGDVLAFLDQPQEALACYDQALGLFRQVGDRLGEANVLQAQGDVLAFLDQRDQALDHYQAALALYRQIGARQGEANCYLGLGRLALAQGQLADAQRWTEQAITLHAANQSRYDVAVDSMTLGRIRVAQGDMEGAVAAFRQAASHYAEIGLAGSAASALTSLGDVLDQAGRKEDALAAYAAAVEIQPEEAMWRRNYANTLIALGRLDEAAAQLDAAEALEPDAPYLALRRAELAKARGERAGAVEWAREALRRRPDWDEAQAVLDWGQQITEDRR